MRVCNARYVSALLMAITACSAKVLSSSTCAVGKRARRGATQADSAYGHAGAQQRNRQYRTVPSIGAPLGKVGIDLGIRDLHGIAHQNGSPDRRTLRDTGSGYAVANSWVLAAVIPDVAFSRRRSPSSSDNATVPHRSRRMRAPLSGRTPAVDRPAMPTSPSAHRSSPPAAQSVRRIRSCAQPVRRSAQRVPPPARPHVPVPRRASAATPR